MCREAYDAWLQKTSLDNDFFAGRLARVTDRQQQLLYVISQVETANDEFTIHDIMEKSEEVLENYFGRSQINQMLVTLVTAGLIYNDRHGKYLFAVPLMADFIKRTIEDRPVSIA